MNPEQFRALVRLKKPSDDLKLELIRQGQPTSAHVELGQTQRAEAPADLPAVANGGTFRIATSSASGHAANANVFFQRAVPAPEGPLGGGQIMVTNTNGQSQTQWSDDQHTLQLEKSGDQPLHLIARDKAGKELFNGPVETPEQLKALSPDLTAKLARAQATLPGTITAHAMTIRAADFINGAVRFEIVNEVDPQGAITVIDPGAHMGVAGTKRARVLTSTQKQTLIVARMDGARAAYLLAFDTSTGKTLFDGPVVIPAQRKSLPGLLSEQLDVLEKNQADAPEFGTMGR